MKQVTFRISDTSKAETSEPEAYCLSIRKISVWLSHPSLMLIGGLVANVKGIGTGNGEQDPERDFVDALKVDLQWCLYDSPPPLPAPSPICSQFMPTHI